MYPVPALSTGMHYGRQHPALLQEVGPPRRKTVPLMNNMARNPRSTDNDDSSLEISCSSQLTFGAILDHPCRWRAEGAFLDDPDAHHAVARRLIVRLTLLAYFPNPDLEWCCLSPPAILW